MSYESLVKFAGGGVNDFWTYNTVCLINISKDELLQQTKVLNNMFDVFSNAMINKIKE